MRILLALAIAAAGVLAWNAGLDDLVREPERVQVLLAGSGLWGPVFLVLAFGLLEPFGVPGIVFVLPAAALWPFPVAVLLCWLGSILAGIVGFSFARYLARDWVTARLPSRLRGYDQRIGEKPVVTVVLVRLTLFLFPPAHWALGLTRVGFVPFLVGTAIGFLPGIVLLTAVGSAGVGWMRSQPPGVWIAVGTLLAGAIAWRRWRGRRSEA